MLINEQTKIADILKHHPDALDAVVSLSDDFRKLRNPILRKLMAGRVSIAMASKIGGCKVQDFYRVLAPLGFEVDANVVITSADSSEQEPKPEYLIHLPADKLIEFDVREIIKTAKDPLKLIMQKVKELKSGEVLEIVNFIEPIPLMKVLAKKGFQFWVNKVSDELFETYFYKTSDTPTVLEEEKPKDSLDWEQMLQKFEGKLVDLDVRHLEMPMPMMTILESLDKLKDEQALYVHHKRIPVFLLTELKDRQFDYRIKQFSDNDVYLLIFKNL